MKGEAIRTKIRRTIATKQKKRPGVAAPAAMVIVSCREAMKLHVSKML